MPCDRLSGALMQGDGQPVKAFTDNSLFSARSVTAPQLFTALAVLIITALTCTPTLGSGSDRPAPATAGDDQGGIMPHRAPERPDFQQSEISRSRTDPGMQHLQERHSDSRASRAPRNLDPTMSTNPDIDPSLRKDRHGESRSVPEPDQRLQ